ncbi:TPA: hypothetical protein N0F65_009506 [Lagenidium giganteum]|uniref:Transposase n=1 Tax=Lagenidium giganteum TaxID=4803 RepID=A0AAV2ZA05_9STRA|nr:TPA: hypothetical protein N0F65_009506 [Lagenidium giganteum]
MRNAAYTKRIRNSVDRTGVISYFWSLRTRIFNMDETALIQNIKTKKFIAARGSSNVWCTTIETRFHLTIVACRAADGYLLPPLFIVPSKRLNRNVLDG